MSDPVGGSYSGLHAVIIFNGGTKDYLVTKGGYDLEQLFDNPQPSGDPMVHGVPVGWKLNSLFVERQMVDDEFLQKLITTTPSTGTANTLATNKSVTAGTEIVMSTSTDSKNGRVRATLNTNPTTVAGYLLFIGTDVNGSVISEAVAVGAADIAGTTYTTTKVFHTCTGCLPVGVVTTGTLTFASVVGATSYGVSTSPGDTVDIVMKLLHPVTAKLVQANFANCYIKKYPVDWQSGKTVSNKIEFEMQNPNTDMTFQSA